MKKSELSRWIVHLYPMLEDDTLWKAVSQAYEANTYKTSEIKEIIERILEEKRNATNNTSSI